MLQYSLTAILLENLIEISNFKLQSGFNAANASEGNVNKLHASLSVKVKVHDLRINAYTIHITITIRNHDSD